MVPNEEDKVERFIGGLPDNIKGNVIAVEPTRLQDAIRVANNLMDQKRKGYARNAKNKRRFASTQVTTVGSNQLSSDKMLEARMWQDLTRLTTMREIGTRLGAMKLQRGLMPSKDDQTLILMSSWVGEHEDENGDDYDDGNGRGNENEGVNGNGGNRSGGGNENGNDNGNGNRNGGGNGYNFGGVIGLTHWFEKMETLFHISNCPQKYQVKYATCTLLNSALTWWNSHKRAIGFEDTYAMKWTELMKLMTEVYCPRNKIQKMESELWNLTVKGNDLTTYIRRFQELVLFCTRMVPNEEDKVERFIGGLPDNIKGNVIAVEPTRLQDAIRVANNLMDQKRKAAVAPNTQRILVGNQSGGVCYKCGRPRHYKKDFLKLRNQNCRNKTGSNEATARAYAIKG
nr:reverse transcriptase domain-containing protein [Tanacetum cinerariifolium]